MKRINHKTQNKQIQLCSEGITINPKFLAAITSDFPDCFLCQGSWQKLRVQKSLKWISKWKIQGEFDLSRNNEASILKQISHIQFPFLQQINISHNKISTLEALHRINIFNLKTFDISDNLITATNSLNKCGFTALQKIDLRNNFIEEISAQFNNFSLLTVFHIQWKGERQQLPFSLANFIAKMSQKFKPWVICSL